MHHSSRYHPYRNAPKTNADPSSISNLRVTHQVNQRTNDIPQISKVGRYLLLDRNAGSSFYRAIDTDSSNEFACKIVDVNKFRDALAPLFHLPKQENINSIVEVLVSDSYAYVFFERSYMDLHTYVRTKRRLKEEEASKLFFQIVSAVAHCHENGVVLRDLKLRKFVFQNKECTSLKLEGLEDASLLQGTDDILEDKHGCPAYVSPEILHSCGGYSGKAADIWSLGVMLYTMIVGRYPFHDTEPSVLFSRIRSGHFTIPETISSKGKCLIRSMMRREPTERLTAHEILEHPWFNSSFPINSPCRIDHKVADQTVPDLNMDDTASFFI